LELTPKGRRLQAANKQLTYVLTIRGKERAGWGGNLVHFVQYTVRGCAFVAVNGRR